nr:hypothetical protein [uncultured Ruminococcus sp.]
MKAGTKATATATVTKANSASDDRTRVRFKWNGGSWGSYTTTSSNTLSYTSSSNLTAGTTYTLEAEAQGYDSSEGASASTVTANKIYFEARNLCTPTFTVGGSTVTSKSIYTNQLLKFTGAHSTGTGTITYQVKKDSGSYGDNYLSAYSGTSEITFTPNGAGTYKIKAHCDSTNAEDADLTVTVTDPGNIYFKHSTTKSDVSGGATPSTSGVTKGQITLAYDSDASAALSGGKASHVVYSTTINNWAKDHHYWVIYDSSRSANRVYTTAITTNASRLSGTGVSAGAWSSGNAGDIDLHDIGSANTKVYYDVVDGKFYADLPIKISYQGYCTAQSKNVGTAATEVVAYGGFGSSSKAITATGYTQVTPIKWYTTNAFSTEYTGTAITGNVVSVTYYTPMTANTYTVTLDANKNGGKIMATSGSAASNTATFTHTYGVADTIANKYYEVIPPTGYQFDGWYNSSGTKKTTVGATDITAAATYTARYTEIKAGATVKAYTNGSASGTGGKVKVGTGTPGATATIDDNTFGITTASPAIIRATTEDGYTFDGWETGGTNGSHITLYTDLECTTAYTGNESPLPTTVYAKTDGTSGMTTENTEIHALFNPVHYTISTRASYTDGGAFNDTNGTTSATCTGGTITFTDSNGGTADYNDSVTISATAASGYAVSKIEMSYDGGTTWETVATDTTAAQATPATTSMQNNTFVLQQMTSTTYKFRAEFRKVYYLTAYSSWVPVGNDFSKIAAPPSKIEVKSDDRTLTYTFSHQTFPTNTGEDATPISASGTFHEGNKIQILAGNEVKLYYSALGSSEAIRGIFFNNGIRYTLEGEPDRKYTNGAPVTQGTGTDDDWKYTYEATTTLFADKNLYTNSETVENGSHSGQSKPTAIDAEDESYTAEIDQDTHVVKFNAAQNYRNIDIELGSKFYVFFANSDGAVIHSKNLDDYYSIGEALSGTTEDEYLYIKAEGDADQTNSIAIADIKAYPADEHGNKASDVVVPGITFAYSSDSTAIENSGTTDSTRYIKVTGNMPNTNIVIEVNPTVKYSMYLDSKIVADGVASRSKFGQVADVVATKSGSAFQKQTKNWDSAPNRVGPNSVNKGDTINYTYTFKDGLGSYYTFNGWYTGDSTGPDYANGYITDKQTLNYTPRKNTYIYAVGTRDLFINGSKYITGATTDWNSANNYDNFKMSFDPSLGTNGKYYWTITPDMYSRVSTDGFTMGGTYKAGEHYYWSDYSKMGNSYFQFYDEATGNSQGALWTNSDALQNDFVTEVSGKIKYGRIRKAENGQTDSVDNWKIQMGAIKFKPSDYPGYDAPITIYYEPGVDAKGKFTVEPSYIYPNIYLSHGYGVGSTSKQTDDSGSYQSELKWMNNGSESSTNISKQGSGWLPNHEGKVNHYKVTTKDATVRVKKTTHANDKISAFFVYDLSDNKVYAIRDVESSGNTYYADIKMQTGHDLYICPIIEEKSADMTVYFDATQLNSNRWGKIVSCYTWYQENDSPTLGEFPGQPMIPSDDGTSWVAKFPSKKGGAANGSEVADITFSNYIDGGKRDNVDHGHSWLAEPGVLPNVTDHTAGTYDNSSSVCKFKYNDMGTADDGTTTYRRINCKVQTYDYREPISYYKNHLAIGSDDITLTFAIKMGNSDHVMSLKHSELKQGNIFEGIDHTHSNGTLVAHEGKFTAKNFQYLTNAKGDQYTDLNGDPLGADNKPSATYYVIAKGEVIYKNGNLEQVFWSGKRNESKSALSYYGTNNSVPTGAGAVNETYTGVSMNYGVEWYVYDASGNYITNILSAGYADYESLTAGAINDDSVLGARLKELGYAVDGKSVAICYDKPRYMYGDDTSDNVKYINSGNNFDSFRATGQWYKNEAFQTATVSVGVGMMTDSGEVLAATNNGGYGEAWARYDTTKGTYSQYASPTPLGQPHDYVTAAQKDAVNTPIRLDASADNFQGWYYYDPGTGEFTKASYTEPDNFRPNYSKDIKYYAMYRAAAIYKYAYQGREGVDYYTTSGGDLTETELTDNLVRTSEAIRTPGGKGQYDVSALAPDASKVSVFKTTLDFSNQTTYDNTTPYFLNIGTVTSTVSNYTLTYYYPDSKNGKLAVHTRTAAYNTTVDLQSIGSTVTGNAPDGKQFIGWYEYNATTGEYGNLLTTQPNYGFVMTKNQTIAAKYDTTAPADDGLWSAYIDDNQITTQMNSATTGKYYNDTIVRFRKGQNAAAHVPQGSEFGVLVLNGGKTNKNIQTGTSNLTNFASNMSSGDTRKIGTEGKTVTKISKIVTDANGTPLTYYNRFDFALRSDYTAVLGSNYTVYAFAKIDGTYYWTQVASGTYE